MKSTYIVLGVVLIAAIGGGFFLLNNKQTPKTSQENVTLNNEASIKDEKAEEAMMGTGYIMKDGKMMVEEGKTFSPMTQDITLHNGTVVTTAGLVTKKDGSSFTLSEGQSMWTDGSFVEAGAMMEESTTGSNDTSLVARYVDYTTKGLTKASEKNGRAILWFAALAWCPSCQAADRDFKAHFDKVPKDVTILKINYDTAKELKQKYSIVMQDTFIQVDSQGKEITRWNSGGQGVEALLANAK